MKQLALILVAGAIALGAWFFFQDSSDVDLLTFDNGDAGSSAIAGSSSSNGDSTSSVSGNVDGLSGEGNEDEDEEFYDDRPAAEIYSSAEQALEAVKKGALDYDDIILEQFVQPGEDCTWCGEFYTQIKDLMLQDDASEDAQAYYSELLAISGDVDNIKTLIDSVQNSQDEDAADIFAESLELTIGDDTVVKHLAKYIDDENELLQESAVAAITNQGSKLAAQTLYELAKKEEDPTGDYDLGIGLGEVIPEEETLPYLQELVLKRDPYSHLGVKALLNYGHDGVVLVFDSLKNSTSPDFDDTMLTDALDHVVYEEQTEEYLKKVLEGSPSATEKKLAEEILEQFSVEADYDDEGEELGE